MNLIQTNQISSFDELFDPVPYEEWINGSLVSTGNL